MCAVCICTCVHAVCLYECVHVCVEEGEGRMADGKQEGKGCMCIHWSHKKKHLCDLMIKRHKVEQIKAYLSAMQNPKNPLYDAVREEKGCRLARGKQNSKSSMRAVLQSSSK